MPAHPVHPGLYFRFGAQALQKVAFLRRVHKLLKLLVLRLNVTVLHLHQRVLHMLVIARYSLIKARVFAGVRELVKPLLLLHPSIFLVEFLPLLDPICIVHVVDDIFDPFIV